ncbi:MAG: peroxiredoxin family protein [Chloroflexi bacterium]|nr:MAG: peroxiredoxin family protein [Chloroflexota bacterium]
MTEESKPRRRRLALVASKGSLDMAYPPLILATTAAAIGWEVGIFFTFYGLDIINKKKLAKLKVAPIGNPAMPAPIPAIPLQVPNIVGMLPGMTELATSFMRSWMQKANIPTVAEMVEMCVEMGVHLYACATTMGVMNVAQEDLIEGVSCLGATGFLDFAAEADVSLFI